MAGIEFLYGRFITKNETKTTKEEGEPEQKDTSKEESLPDQKKEEESTGQPDTIFQG